MRTVTVAFTLLILLSPCLTAGGEQFAIDDGANPHAVPTFACLGLYWRVDSGDPGECLVSYRERGGSAWKEAHPLWFDSRDREFRGSIVGLEPATGYEVRLRAGTNEKLLTVRTRSEDIPVGKTTHIDGGILDIELHVTEPGTPDAWHLVTPRPGEKTTIDCENFRDYNIVVEASYVIIRGFELKNAATHGILIREGVHDVAVEDCRITYWGRSGGPRSFGNSGGSDSAVYAEKGTAGLIVQRNLIEHPRGASNDWDTGHPNGPQGITLINSKGGNIIRYNEIRSTEDHGFNDGIGGGSNYSFEGSPCRDSDIYGNIITNAWDDAIESEGANMNVRIWGNYIDHTFQHVATASTTSTGPHLYIPEHIRSEPPDTRSIPLGGSMIKIGERDPYIGGRSNTYLSTIRRCNHGVHSAFSAAIPRPTSSRATTSSTAPARSPVAANRHPPAISITISSPASTSSGATRNTASGESPPSCRRTHLNFIPRPRRRKSNGAGRRPSMTERS